MEQEHSRLQNVEYQGKLARASSNNEVINSEVSQDNNKFNFREPTVIPTGDEHIGTIKGIVKKFGGHSGAGYGHIYGPNREEYFVHYSDIKSTGFRNLASGQHVEFQGYLGKKGLYAVEVTVI